jgi:hypothetical protein
VAPRTAELSKSLEANPSTIIIVITSRCVLGSRKIRAVSAIEALPSVRDRRRGIGEDGDGYERGAVIGARTIGGRRACGGAIGRCGSRGRGGKTRHETRRCAGSQRGWRAHEG